MKLEKRVITDVAEFNSAHETISKIIEGGKFPTEVIPMTSLSEECLSCNSYIEEFLLADPSVLVLWERLRGDVKSDYAQKYTLIGNSGELDKFYDLMEERR